MALPTEHPRCVELVMAVRNRHLEIILELLNPRGVGVLVTDFVATETAPELAQLDELLLPRAAAKWIEERNFFTGANPFAIRDYCNRSRGPGPSAADAQEGAVAMGHRRQAARGVRGDVSAARVSGL
jgi:hypothetical protein